MCERCDQLFGSETLFNRHICNPQPVIQTVHCDQCQYTSSNVRDFVTHLLEVHQHFLGTYQCSFCDFEAIENKTLRQHIEDTHGVHVVLNRLSRNQASLERRSLLR